MGVPFAWGFPHSGSVWSGQYNAMGQPIYIPYPQYDTQEAVLGMGEVGPDKDKDKTEDKEGENETMDSQLDSSASHETVPAAPLVSLTPEIKNEATSQGKSLDLSI